MSADDCIKQGYRYSFEKSAKDPHAHYYASYYYLAGHGFAIAAKCIQDYLVKRGEYMSRPEQIDMAILVTYI